MSKLRLENVSYVYRDEKAALIALQEINISVERGEFVSIIGPSGCGKSTLLSLLAGLNSPSGGCILLDGRTIKGTGTDRGVVFQHYSLFPWMTARNNVIFGIKQVRRGRSKKEIEDLADEYLALVGLKDFAGRYPAELSGGMQQRVAIARAFAMDPDILLMDEPFGALDAKNRLILQEVLLNLRDKGREKKTVIFVTHDVDEAIQLSDRIVVMSARPGEIMDEVVVPFPRPRDRTVLTGTSEYAGLRNKLISLFYDDLLSRIGGPEVMI